jgi:hypothetical protein
VKLFDLSTLLKLTSIQLIDTADPIEAALGEVIESDEVVVSRDSMHGTDANFMQPMVEVFSDANGLLEILDADVGHGGDHEQW